MKFEVKRSVIESVLNKAANVVATKDLLPILKNFDVTLDENRMRVVATDLELSVIAQTELVDVEEVGRAVFPAKTLLDIIKSSEDGVVSVSVAEDVAVFQCAGATWSINLMDASDYPEVPDAEDYEAVEVTRLILSDALYKVKGAAAKEGVRPALQMIDIADGNVRASDGAIFRQVIVDELKDQYLQIPLGAVEDLVKLLRGTEADRVGIGQTEDHILFIIGEDVFIVTKNNVEYPDVEEELVIPAKRNNIALTVDRYQLINGIRRVRVTADEDTKGLVLDLTPNLLTLRAKDKYGNFATQTIDVHYEGAERQLGVNHENMIDTIVALDSPSISIMLGQDSKMRKSPLFIEDGNITSILQQLKIDVS